MKRLPSPAASVPRARYGPEWISRQPGHGGEYQAIVRGRVARRGDGAAGVRARLRHVVRARVGVVRRLHAAAAGFPPPQRRSDCR